jgi:hypothetical protein
VAGTPLKGLGFVKNKPEPLALEDDAYPEWLWRVLDKKAGGEDAVGGEGDMFCKFFPPSTSQQDLHQKVLPELGKGDENALCVCVSVGDPQTRQIPNPHSPEKD